MNVVVNPKSASFSTPAALIRRLEALQNVSNNNRKTHFILINLACKLRTFDISMHDPRSVTLI
jgi:hypothetical protein